jgi:glucarate dehydratase
MTLTRRTWLKALLGGLLARGAAAAGPARREGPLKITGLRVTPIALPDPPLLAASGCHGPYFLRNIVQVETDAGITGVGETRTPEAMVREAERFHQRWGFTVFKLKGGVLPPRAELETMRALDAHFRGRRRLRIDPNARWRTETAVSAGKELRKVNLEYYEDPVRGQKAMAEVRRATKLPMSTNMCVTRFEHVRQAAQLHPVDVVLCDHHYWGGIPACQELGRLCAALGWGVSQHSNSHAGLTMAAMIHVGAVVPQLTIASDTHYPWLPDGADILQGAKLPIRGGRMRVPEGPGLGVRLDPDKVARAHEVYNKSGMRRRDDGYTMRLVEPGWKPEPF